MHAGGVESVVAVGVGLGASALGHHHGGRTRVGVVTDGAGRYQGVGLEHQTQSGRPIVNMTLGPDGRVRAPQTPISSGSVPPPTPHEIERAKSTFTITTDPHLWNFSIKYVDTKEYHKAKNTSSSSELMSLIGRKWTIGNYDRPYEAFTDFPVFTEAERRGKSGFRFEKTYLQWHFGVSFPRRIGPRNSS